MRFYAYAMCLPRRARPQAISLRRRLAVYLVALTLSMALITLLALYLLGAVSSADRPIEETLSYQLEDAAADMLRDADDAAACGLNLAAQLSGTLSSELRARGLSFDALTGNSDALTDIQRASYSVLMEHMKLAPCSGAFYMLSTTSNPHLPARHYNGLYLKYANLNAENTIRNKVCMFRGSSAIAREQHINLYSTWQPEMAGGTFAQAEDILTGNVRPSYLLTEPYALPDSWERARLMCMPIYLDGNIVGVCGFEISDLYFRLAHRSDSGIARALLTESGKAWQGQTSLSRYAASQGQFALTKHRQYAELSYGQERFIGIMCKVSIGDSTHSIAVMLPMARYEQLMRGRHIRAAGALICLAALSATACAYLSRRYVSPILRGLSQLKTQERAYSASNISEIDDLSRFLAEKERGYEAELLHLKREREYAEHELSILRASCTADIDPDICAQFTQSLSTLTPREREIFDLYMAGSTGKDIQAILGINPNTVKYHNKNIYDKLGVHSRKELVRYAEIARRR